MAEPRIEVVLDTNFLLLPSMFGVDVLSEIGKACLFSYRLVTVDAAVAELKRLAEKGLSGKESRAARLAMELLRKHRVKVVKVSERKVFKTADDAILALAKQQPGTTVVATQDGKLRALLKAEGVKVAVLRQRRYVKVL